MSEQPHAKVSNLSRLLKRMSLPTNDLPYKKRQRTSSQVEKRLRLSRSMTELPNKLSGKRKRMSSNRRISMLQETTELPEEVIQVQILTRLPVKSVARFKSVCKSWLSLFSDPQFLKALYDDDCLVAQSSDRGKRTKTVVISSRFEQKHALHLDRSYSLIGSAKGLVCIRRDNILSLWNPAIHQSKEIHLPPLDFYSLIIRTGFGFDPVTNDYKVVICYRACSYGLSRLRYAVYSSNADSWIQHDFNDPEFENLISDIGHSKTPDTMVKDCPYWTCCTRPSVRNKKILSLAAIKFDATNNKFKLLPEIEVSCQTKLVVNMKDLLTLMAYKPRTLDTIDIYSLDEEKGCGGVWSKMYRFGPFKHCGDFRFGGVRFLRQGFNNGDEIVYVDHKTDASTRIPVTQPGFTVCFTYNPSLVFLQGMTSNYLENRSPPLIHGSQLDNSFL